MDVNDLRIAVTLLSFACFGAIVVWTLSRRNTTRFEEAARVPFEAEGHENGDQS
jgi:cytochrome c oxidase cbb3-type subunit 4